MNEYLGKVLAEIPDVEKSGYDYERIVDSYKLRDELTKQYAWAIPTDAAIECIAKYSPLVEIGAGTGYWASLLRKAGAKVDAYDRYPPNGASFEEGALSRDQLEEWLKRNNWYHRGAHSHTLVERGTQSVLKRYPSNWNLFLCWPVMSNMPRKALQLHAGEFVCYVGEGYWGCNANDSFFDYLEKHYREIEWESIPQWNGIHDSLHVYQRKDFKC